ncbi:fumarylacetoacetate hydrolase family protein [Hyaloraphidium curvatum]|nr:fumarylacetoacetate hydrolase family protein [Hyaloraphidium curvatum]
MAPSWQRLVRFKTPSGAVVYGDPSAFLAGGELGTKAHVVEGGVFGGKVTARVEEIAEVLGPLEMDDVPVVACIGLNYRAHALESKMPIPEFPVLFYKPKTSIAGPGPIAISSVVAKQNQLDYEGELGVVIGRGGKDIPEDKALDHVLGYVAANDVSARIWQRSVGGQFCYGKGFDGFAPIGPMLVSPSLVPDPSKLQLTTKVNGKVRQSSPTSDLIFSVPKIISFLSAGYTLLPGTVIMTGTPSGVGMAMGPDALLKDGDVVDVSITGLGTLSNRMVHEKAQVYRPQPQL